MYMDLRPEVAQQIHSSLCGSTDKFPSRKPPPSDGSGGGSTGTGSQQQPGSRENVPMNGQQGDIELGMGVAALPGSRRPPSGLTIGRLTSISENSSSLGSSGERSQKLPRLQQVCAR
jgi:hypothetical protein